VLRHHGAETHPRPDPRRREMTIGEQLLVVDGPLARRVADLRTAFAV
jgi:hypothetical protein